MSAISCTCDTGVNGFGFIDCFGKPSRVVGVAFQQLKSGGAENYLVAPISQSNWEGSLWNKTASLRISVLNDVKEYSSDRDDAITETIDDIDYYLKDGKKMISFTVIGAPYKLKAYVDGLRCGRNGVYFISESGQLLGRRRTNLDEIGLIPIQKGTVTSKMIDATVSTFSKMMVTFQLDERYDDSEFVYVESDEITADLQDTEAMIQATASGLVSSSTTIQVILSWSASGVVNANANFEYLENFDVSSYFYLYNNTTSAAVTISAITESSAGVYDLTFAAQTTSDSLTLSAGALAPFDFADITGLVAL